MYSGTTFHTKSGRIMGVHQKIDRIARRHLRPHIARGSFFPLIRDILHFEGANGPDGIKRKSPGKDEPWHYVNPNDPSDTALVDMILDHIHNLAAALKEGNRERAAFESAWLAHAITDGLTPAHHYPLEDKLVELRGGQGIETRTTKRKKIVMPGKTTGERMKNNWEYWGAKGVMTTHLNFELGVASALATMKFDTFSMSKELKTKLIKSDFKTLFYDALSEVDGMKMYEEFTKKGWTRNLAKETKNVLVPTIIRTVMLGWLSAIWESEKNT